MDLVEVKIKGTVVTSRYGSLEAGDILRTDAEFARHLVEDCAAADYVKAKKKNVTDNQTDQPKSTAKKAKG